MNYVSEKKSRNTKHPLCFIVSIYFRCKCGVPGRSERFTRRAQVRSNESLSNSHQSDVYFLTRFLFPPPTVCPSLVHISFSSGLNGDFVEICWLVANSIDIARGERLFTMMWTRNRRKSVIWSEEWIFFHVVSVFTLPRLWIENMIKYTELWMTSKVCTHDVFRWYQEINRT